MLRLAELAAGEWLLILPPLYVYVCTAHAYLGQGDDREGAPALRLEHHRHKLPIHRTHVALVRRLGDTDIVVAILLLVRRPEDVAELGRAYETSGHVQLQLLRVASPWDRKGWRRWGQRPLAQGLDLRTLQYRGAQKLPYLVAR